MPEKIKPLNCFKCDREFEQVFPEGNNVQQPYDGTIFHTYGHYGSSVFDPMNGSYLEINICDACLLANKEKVLHYSAPKNPGMPWNPREH